MSEEGEEKSLSGEKMSPDIRLEQIISTAVAANEALRGDFLSYPQNQKKYDALFLSRGPELYIGVLLAAGISLLKREKKKLIFLYEQKTDPEKIIISEPRMGPYIGKIYNDQQSNKKKSETQEEEIKLPKDILLCMEYLSVIGVTEKILFMGYGSQVKCTQKEIRALQHIDIQKTNLIVRGNVSEGLPYEKSVLTDKKRIEASLDYAKGKTKRSLKNLPLLLQVFAIVTQHAGLSRDVVGYLNSGDFTSTKKETTGYVCLVA